MSRVLDFSGGVNVLFCDPATRIYQRRALLALGVYVLATLSIAYLVARGLVPQALMIPVALLPVVPAAFVLPPVLAALRTMDELQRKIQYEGIAFAFGVTAIASLGVGFLQMFAGFPDVNWVWVWPFLGSAWMAGTLLSRRRYR
jgi:hypothetical protein